MGIVIEGKGNKLQKLRLYDVRMSRLPTVIGLCRGDVPGIAGYVNSAQRRLLYAKEAGDEGWYGTWAEIAFNVSRTQPYWTAPRDVARLQAVDICQKPYPINNQLFEYLQFGNGRLPKQTFRCTPVITQVFTRNTVPTFVDLPTPPNLIRVYFTDPADIQAGLRVLLQGSDNNDIPIWTQDGLNQVQGIFVVADTPFASPITPFNTLTGIQKDQTQGQVKIYAVDQTTGAQTLLVTMQPDETTAAYRRYYFDNLPATCCQNALTNLTTPQTLTLTGIVKLELMPVFVDTDYCLIQNLEAIIEEAQSIRYSEIDTPQAKQMAQEKHKQAIGLLNGELAHYIGIDEPAVEFAPFGAAHLHTQRIGTMI